MKVSAMGMRMIINYEGMRNSTYDDRTGKPIFTWNKFATIGIGHLIQEDEWDEYKNGISDKECMLLFCDDLTLYERIIHKLEAQIGIPGGFLQHQFDMLVSLCYNIGISNFEKSSVKKILLGQKANYNTLEEAWLAFNKQKGRFIQGIMNRRKKEYEIFTHGY